MSFDGEPQTLSLTHHTFLVGAWQDAGDGAVLVTHLDDENAVVLILKPDDVDPFIAALVAVQAARRASENKEPGGMSEK